MSSSSLASAIATFERALPAIRERYGQAWAVVVGEKVAGAFRDFASASEFVEREYPAEPALIRHTDMLLPEIPFVAIED